MRVKGSDFCKSVSTDLCQVSMGLDGIFIMDMMKTKSKEFKADVSFKVLTRGEVKARVEKWMALFGPAELPWS